MTLFDDKHIEHLQEKIVELEKKVDWMDFLLRQGRHRSTFEKLTKIERARWWYLWARFALRARQVVYPGQPNLWGGLMDAYEGAKRRYEIFKGMKK